MGPAHTGLIRALQGRSKATDDAGMAPLTSKAGSKRVAKKGALKKFGKIVFKGFLGRNERGRILFGEKRAGADC